MTTIINWINGQPAQAGYYLVAVKLASAVGYFDMVIWNGQEWECLHPERIIGHFSFEALKSHLSFSWPEYDTVDGLTGDNADSEKQDWEEV